MSVYSMTGYASAASGPRAGPENANKDAKETLAPTGADVVVELRSVNSRFLDIAWRLPDETRSLEAPLRELIVARLRRGKLDVRVSFRRSEHDTSDRIDPERLRELAEFESQVLCVLPEARRLAVAEALDRCRSKAEDAVLPDAIVLDTARHALAALVEARRREGDKLVQVLKERLGHLRGLATQAAPLVPQVVQRQQARFLERWNEALASAGATQGNGAQAAQDRALQEAAAHALRIDVAEELARLTAHLDEIDHLLDKGGEVGKRLDFLIQELQREANTLGSKSAALELTHISVEMKVAIEQMREQVQNLE
jgi:uncharacterized protein (TIGR00255 family)